MTVPVPPSGMGDIRAVLIQCYTTSVNPPSSDALAQAEQALKGVSQQPMFAISTLKIVQDSSVDVAVRMAAALNFKNVVRSSWAPSEDAQAASNGSTQMGVVHISDQERTEIKQFIVTLMLQSEEGLRRQLSAALALIAKSDFPSNWNTLLPELAQKLGGGNLDVQVGVLETMDSIFRMFRTATIEEMNDTLDYCQKLAARPVLECAQSMHAAADQAAGSRETLVKVCAAARLASEVVFSLNVFGLSMLMAELAAPWMESWKRWLAWHNDAAGSSDPDVESPEDALKATVCTNCHQFLQMQEEDMQEHLEGIVSTVWTLLIACGPRKGQDNLAMAAMAFLTTVCRSTYHKLFGSGDTIKQICEGIIIPNVRFRDDDEDDFENNYKEFLRRDLEGSDSETRRRSAADFVRSLVDRFPAETTQIVTQYINTLLAQYAADPAAQWATKNCALYMVMALAVRGKTLAAGATTVNELVDFEQFCREHVLPEIGTDDVNARPVLKADALRYIYLFRSKLSKALLVDTFPKIVRLVGADSNVVHSYAAIALERLLALHVAGSPLLAPADVSRHLEGLLKLLFEALGKEDSTENEYLVKCVMRVVTFVGPQIVPIAGQCLDWLTGKLLEVCKNPVFAGFNHYLFESVAALLVAARGDAATLSSLETRIFGAFEIVLQQDVQEFHPYVFQVFALVLSASKELRPEYVETMLPLFLRHDYWERKGNIPALTMLLQAYLRRTAPAIVAKGYLEPVLGIFAKLLAISRHYAEAYALLQAVLAHVPPADLQRYLPSIFKMLFGALTGPQKSTKNTCAFIVTVCKMACWHGAAAAAGALDAAQPNASAAILSQVMPNNLAHISGREAKRAVGIAVARFLSEHEPLLADSAAWTRLLQALVQSQLASAAAPAAEGVDNSALEESMQDVMEYSNEFSKLANAQLPPTPLCPEVEDAPAYLAKCLAQLSQRRPGTLQPMLAQLEPECQKALTEGMQRAGVTLL